MPVNVWPTASRTSVRIVDLTLTLKRGMRGVELAPEHTIGEHGWNSSTLHLYSHCGTHMDAPAHFVAGSGTVEQIPLERCIGPAWVLDLTPTAPRELITVERLGTAVGKVQRDDMLLLKTGWSEFVDQPEHYRNNLPRIGRELAFWCVERRVRLVGVEAPSVADVNCLEEVTEIHRILLGNSVTIVEGLANLGELSEQRVLFVAAPLKIEHGDSSPCRAFAVEGIDLQGLHTDASKAAWEQLAKANGGPAPRSSWRQAHAD
ncbi:MAG: cyclase family protein [Planctomycetaceae bacterium]